MTKNFQSPHLRVWATPDLKGLEWASALVGCLSIGVGFAEEAGAGPGLVAALISRGVDEAARIMVAAGGEERTMVGLGGYGGLLASIALEDRPEVAVGRALAQGVLLEDALARVQLRIEAGGVENGVGGLWEGGGVFCRRGEIAGRREVPWANAKASLFEGIKKVGTHRVFRE